MHKYSYGPAARSGILLQQIGGVIGLFVSTGIAILLFWGTGKVEVPSTSSLLQNPQLTLVCIGIWALIVGWIVSLTLINSFPTIWLGETGMMISAFLFFYIYISWSEIMDINPGSVRFGHCLVRARRITVFHRVYGLLYSHTLYPSFLIGKNIEDREQLFSEIKRGIQKQK
jgi:hypothetical protein